MRKKERDIFVAKEKSVVRENEQNGEKRDVCYSFVFDAVTKFASQNLHRWMVEAPEINGCDIWISFPSNTMCFLWGPPAQRS